MLEDVLFCLSNPIKAIGTFFLSPSRRFFRTPSAEVVRLGWMETFCFFCRSWTSWTHIYWRERKYIYRTHIGGQFGHSDPGPCGSYRLWASLSKGSRRTGQRRVIPTQLGWVIQQPSNSGQYTGICTVCSVIPTDPVAKGHTETQPARAVGSKQPGLGGSHIRRDSLGSRVIPTWPGWRHTESLPAWAL